MKKIMVTGCIGFIGFHMSRALLARNYYVVGVDNCNDAYDISHKNRRLSQLKRHANFVMDQGDIINKNYIHSFVAHHQLKIIIHLAARTGVRASLKQNKLYHEVNVIGTQNLYEAAQKNHVAQFIFASSSSVYGNSTRTPFSENLPLPKPPSPYAASKQRAEQILKNLYSRYSVPTTILRFFSVFGPFGRPDMAPYLFTDAVVHNKLITQYGDGSTARDYTYIDDIIAGIIKTLEHPFDFETINLGNNHPITLKKLIETIEAIAGKKCKKVIKPALEQESVQTWADITRARKLLGWQPQVSFEEGMKRFIVWYRNNRL